MDNRYNRHNRRKYSLKVHIVLVTKYRKQILKGSIADDVKQKIYDICNSKGYDIIAMETDKDHIHFLINYDTTVHRKPRLTDTNLQGSSHRPRAVGFRLRQSKGFYL
jgi:REP element-mobilizing transposase RayT